MDFDTDYLFDIIARKQLYVEGVKTEATNEFRKVVAKLAAEMRRIFGAIPYETLGEMSRLELQVLINEIKKAQDESYEEWLALMLLFLRGFAEADYLVSQKVFGSFAAESEEVAEDKALVLPVIISDDTLWSRTKNATMFATGTLMLSFLGGFITAAKASVLAAVNKAVLADKSPADALKDVVAPVTGPGTGGVLTRLPNQSKGVLDTILQHESQQASNEILKKQYKRYQWVSVLDSRTTDICRGLNGRIFEYGKGPLPPAHINCRSSVVPIVETVPDFSSFNVYDWLRKQSEQVQNDILGKSGAEIFRKGEMTKDEVDAKLKQVPALSIEQYKGKVKNIYGT